MTNNVRLYVYNDGGTKAFTAHNFVLTKNKDSNSVSFNINAQEMLKYKAEADPSADCYDLGINQKIKIYLELAYYETNLEPNDLVFTGRITDFTETDGNYSVVAKSFKDLLKKVTFYSRSYRRAIEVDGDDYCLRNPTSNFYLRRIGINANEITLYPTVAHLLQSIVNEACGYLYLPKFDHGEEDTYFDDNPKLFDVLPLSWLENLYWDCNNQGSQVDDERYKLYFNSFFYGDSSVSAQDANIKTWNDAFEQADTAFSAFLGTDLKITPNFEQFNNKSIFSVIDSTIKKYYPTFEWDFDIDGNIVLVDMLSDDNVDIITLQAKPDLYFDTIGINQNNLYKKIVLLCKSVEKINITGVNQEVNQLVDSSYPFKTHEYNSWSLAEQEGWVVQRISEVSINSINLQANTFEYDINNYSQQIAFGANYNLNLKGGGITKQGSYGRNNQYTETIDLTGNESLSKFVCDDLTFNNLVLTLTDIGNSVYVENIPYPSNDPRIIESYDDGSGLIDRTEYVTLLKNQLEKVYKSDFLFKGNLVIRTLNRDVRVMLNPFSKIVYDHPEYGRIGFFKVGIVYDDDEQTINYNLGEYDYNPQEYVKLLAKIETETNINLGLDK